MKTFSTPYFKGKELVTYLEERLNTKAGICKLENKKNFSIFSKVIKPLYVFKKVYTSYSFAIANLIIPVGETAHAGFFQKGLGIVPNGKPWKLRCSGVIVHSLVSENGLPISYAFSSYNNKFIYRADLTKVLRPSLFYDDAETCAAGIHFLLNLKDAWEF